MSQEPLNRVDDNRRGIVLSGCEISNQVFDDPVPESFLNVGPSIFEKRHCTYSPGKERTWQNIEGIPKNKLFSVHESDALFNGDEAAYRTSFHESYYGVRPQVIPDMNGDGIDELLTMCHYAWVDGKKYAGEVHIYFGRKDRKLDPKVDKPDIVFYGGETGGKLGIDAAGAFDFSGRGKTDIVLSASFCWTKGEDKKLLGYGGKVYVIFGHALDLSQRPLKIRIEDVGVSVPGVVFEGGHDGSLYLGWANCLDSGDFDGDGRAEILIGSYDLYGKHDFSPRAYLLSGGDFVEEFIPRFRLGVDTNLGGISCTTFTTPNPAYRKPKGFEFAASFVGDLNGDGCDEIALTLSIAGQSGGGAVYVFSGRRDTIRGSEIDFLDADMIIEADEEQIDDAPLDFRFTYMQTARPGGDINGNGFGDLVICAKGSKVCIDGESVVNGGMVGVFYGRAKLPRRLSASKLDVYIHGERGGYVGHPGSNKAADLDGDGYADILINDPHYVEKVNGELQARGRIWMIRGGPNLPKLIAIESMASRTFLPDTRYPGMLGFAWNVGDLNGDGKSEIIISDHYIGNESGHVHAGGVYLIYNDTLNNVKKGKNHLKSKKTLKG